MQKVARKKKAARNGKAERLNPPSNKTHLRLNTSITKKATRRKPAAGTRTITKGAKAPFPKRIQPMLATLVDKPFDEPAWSYEIKWDGYRAIAYLQNDRVELISRNNKSFNEKFYPILAELKKWKKKAVLDGEIIIINGEGISDFDALQN